MPVGVREAKVKMSKNFLGQLLCRVHGGVAHPGERSLVEEVKDPIELHR